MTSTVDTRRLMSTRALVLCACLAQVTIVLDTTIIAVALPAAQADLGFADAGRQWTITAYTLAFGSLLLIGGRLSQFLGIRMAFLIGLAGFGAASLVGGFAGTFETLISARVGQGVFAALLAPTNLSLMNTAFPEARTRSKAFAIFGSVAGGGAALGLILGGVLTETLSWRWCLIVNVPITLLTAVIAIRVLRGVAGPRRSDVTADIIGLVLGSTGIFGLVFGFSRADELGWRSGTVTASLASGIVLLALFLVRERYAREPVLPLGIIANGVRAGSYLSIALVGLSQMGSALYLTFYFQQNQGYSALQTGVAFLPMVLGLVVAAVVSTRILVPRTGLRVVFPIGAAITSLGFYGLSRLGIDASYSGDLLVPIVVVGLGLGLIMAPAMSSATHGIGVERSGLASAVANTSQQLGASLGVAFLSTYAARIGADFLADGRDEITRKVASALVEAQVAPSSPSGLEIAARIAADFGARAEVEAYSSGFGVLGAIGLGTAAALIALFLGTRTGKPSR